MKPVRFHGRWLTVFLAIICFGSVLSIAAQTNKATLGGTVVSDTGRPVKYATVQLYLETSGTNIDGAGNTSPSTQTDRKGHFSIDNLRPGTYRLHVYQMGYVNPTLTGDAPQQVVVGEGQEVTDLDITLLAGGAITGKIVDEDSDPFVNVQAIAWRKMENNSFQQVNQAQTDDRGVYRIFGLPPGEYIVSCQIPQRSSRQAASYGMVYYPEGIAQKDAKVLSVSSGSEASAIDFNLRSEDGGKLTGRVTVRSTKKPLAGLNVNLYGENVSLSTTTDAEGNYEFAGLPQSTFNINVTPTNQNIVPVQKQVKIDAKGTVKLDLQVDEGAEIRGVLELVGNRTIRNDDSLYVQAEVVSLKDNRDGGYSGSPQVSIERDGNFVVRGLPASKVRLSLQASTNKYYLKSVYRGETELGNGEVAVETGERIKDVRLVLSDEVGRVKAIARQHEEGAAKSYQVILVPADETRWNDYKAYRYGWSDGQQPLVIEGIPAGGYLAFAMEASLGFAGEQTIRDYQSSAIAVTVRPGDLEEIEVEPLTMEDFGMSRQLEPDGH